MLCSIWWIRPDTQRRESVDLGSSPVEDTKYACADLIRRRGTDVVQPDNRRVGGVSEWMESAAIADGYEVEVFLNESSRINTETRFAVADKFIAALPAELPPPTTKTCSFFVRLGACRR